MNKGLLYEYTGILNGSVNGFSQIYFNNGRRDASKNALEVIRYAVEIFLHWTPEQTKAYLDEKVIGKMKLDKAAGFIDYPAGLDPNKDYWYISHLLYPDIIPFSEEDVTIKIYQDILKDVEDGGRYRFPKGFFDGIDGRKRAKICLRYLIHHYESFDNTKDMYRYFSTRSAINDLNRYGLKLVWKNVFDSPVIFLHESLKDDEKNEFLFHYYEFLYRFDEYRYMKDRVNKIKDNQDVVPLAVQNDIRLFMTNYELLTT